MWGLISHAVLKENEVPRRFFVGNFVSKFSAGNFCFFMFNLSKEKHRGGKSLKLFLKKRASRKKFGKVVQFPGKKISVISVKNIRKCVKIDSKTG